MNIDDIKDKIEDQLVKALCERNGWEYGDNEEYDIAVEDVKWFIKQYNSIPINKGGVKTAKVICLCGSTRFTGEMLVKQWELTKLGNIVVSWCALPDGYFQGEDKTHIGDQEGVKEIVDEVHKRKIDLCDEVFVLNINGYIGESTASEIAYAEKIGRPIKYWQILI